MHWNAHISLPTLGRAALYVSTAAMLYEAVVAAVTADPKGWITHLDDNHLVFRKPILYRVSLGCMAAFFAAGAMAVGNAVFGPSLGVFRPIYFAAFLGVALLIWRAAGPQEVSVNLKERSYRAVVGWPMVPRTKIGRLDETGKIMFYGENVVVLQPNLTSRERFVLGALLPGGKAHSLAKSVAQATHLTIKDRGSHRAV